jgi:predicted kinase
MIVELNGLPGVGKFTIARVLAGSLGARLVDNHTIYNPAFASTSFRSPDFYETVRAVRTITFGNLEKVSADVPVILTIAPGVDLAWGREWQTAIKHLAKRRDAALLGVHLHCSGHERVRRMSTPSRALMGKLIDADLIDDGLQRPVLLDHCDETLELDVTALDASGAADAILCWLNSRNREYPHSS